MIEGCDCDWGAGKEEQTPGPYLTRTDVAGPRCRCGGAQKRGLPLTPGQGWGKRYRPLQGSERLEWLCGIHSNTETETKRKVRHQGMCRETERRARGSAPRVLTSGDFQSGEELKGCRQATLGSRGGKGPTKGGEQRS